MGIFSALNSLVDISMNLKYGEICGYTEAEIIPQKKVQEAMQQIINKNYAKPYPHAVCVGMAIDDKARQITKFIRN
jgi:hypothetical protein